MITSPFPQALKIRMYRASPYYPLQEYFEVILLYRKEKKRKKEKKKSTVLLYF